MIRNIISTLVITISMTTATMAQTQKTDKFSRAWKQIDSLMDRGLPQSAAGIARQVLASAQDKNDSPNTIKAQLFLMGVDHAIQDNAAIRNIQRIDSMIQISAGAEKALWQSINAEQYWQYYQRNRWTILGRTPIVGTPPEDIATWDAASFINKASNLYQASLLDSETLKPIPVARYAPLLVEGENTRHLRPTLYDFLAFRAIEFFKNDEKDVIRPAYQFQIDGTLWFEPAQRFSQVKVNPADPEALHFRALHTYQQILAFHLNDEQRDALIDADLQRLAFVHQYSVHPKKDSLYLQSLQSLERRYPNIPAAAQVAYQKLRFLYDNRLANTTDTLDLRALKQQLDVLIERFPGTEGASNAAQFRHTLTSKSVTLQSEAVVLPGENSKVLVTYRNLNRVFMRIYHLPANLDAHRRGLSDEEQARLFRNKPLQSWEVALPGAEDLNEHRAELKVDPLPNGSYLLVVSAKQGFMADENTIHAVPFQVSNVSMLTQHTAERNGLVALHRKSGMPLRGAQVIFWENRWDAKTKDYEYIKLAESRTDEDGKAAIAAPNTEGRRINRITLIAHGDTLQTDGYYYPQARNGENEEKTRIQAFLFTDRAIYRPGQTIYFKGIMVEHDIEQKSNAVLAGEKTEVKLYDANNQEVTAIQLTTNAYGSFSGKFTAPSGGLTGEMRIANDHGTAYFSVEEYKRPKFQVTFDTVKSTVALNERVIVTGHARAYAGNNIDGAEVKYRVVRRAHFPYFWAFRRWGQPSSPEMEIASGIVQTNADGSFEIPFTTVPDRQIDPETLPVFTYTVYADVTDINGETQSGSQGIHAGYRALQIQASIPEQLDARETHQLVVQTQNLNQVPTPADVSVSIAPLQFPGKLYRKRLWEKPDQYLLSESEFRAAFPDDEYGDEADYMTWQVEKPIWNTTLNTAGQTETELPATLWKSEGWHVIELQTTDAKGDTIMEKKYVYISYPTADNRPQTALSVNSGKLRALEPGETLTMTVKTGYDSTYVLESNTDVRPEFTAFSEYRLIERPISESDRGGLGYRWIYVHNNRVYTASRHIDVPWSNRDLQLEWATHRNKLLPGEPEEWRLTIKGNKKDAVAAELVAGLYDASLDALRPHHWTWDKLSPTNHLDGYWNTQEGFGTSRGTSWQNTINGVAPDGYDKRYDRLFSYRTYVYRKNIGIRGVSRVGEPVAESQGSLELAGKTAGIQASEEVAVVGYGEDRIQDSAANENAVQPSDETTIPVRTNLQETAFFLPELATDAEGNVTLRFTLPEALTEWKLMALAHTTDWKTGYLEGTVKTQKDLMVMPNLPRFLRQGDGIRISTKISNISTAALEGVARLTLLDATTLEPISGFGEAIASKDFAVDASQSTTVDWMLEIPDDYFSPVVVRITAKAGNFTDGEENTLPVISNRTLVTETLPLPIRGNESKNFTLPKLLEEKSNTLTHHALTVEFTGNPAWYAVQALPYLMEYPYECAEQVFNRFYATALAAHIVAQSPRVKAIFDRWKTSDTTALLSNLEKNQALKSALLEETPWVMEARDESEQKRRIALLFDSHKLARGLQQNLAKLAEMQLADGSFPWFRGMTSNRYITQYIATGIARLQKLGVAGANTATAHKILASAVGYADQQVKSEYDRLLENKADLKKQHIGNIHVQYLYMRSLLGDVRIPEESQVAYRYYLTQAVAYWPQFNPYLKGQLALALNRGNDQKTAAGIMESLRETAIRNEEMGMYWKSMPNGYWWYEAPIEAQSLLVEAFAEVAKDPGAVDDLKVWLLKQKQTQHWNTTKATADAVYALLLQGSDWLSNEPVVTITIGPETIRSTEVKTEAGTGYFKKRIEGNTVTPAMGNISVQVDQTENEGVAWGAVYWQYFENLDKITGAETPLSLRKQLYIERNTDRGPVLEEITPANPLKVGDKVNVRIELRVDRDMEYVHLKDMRAACFEPINVLSGYRYQGGLGYYESTRDVSTNFFFDYLRKGTYVFEYQVFVSQAGDFSNGISTIQSMYAPEFSSHSEGIRVKVAGGQ